MKYSLFRTTNKSRRFHTRETLIPVPATIPEECEAICTGIRVSGIDAKEILLNTVIGISTPSAMPVDELLKLHENPFTECNVLLRYEVVPISANLQNKFLLLMIGLEF